MSISYTFAEMTATMQIEFFKYQGTGNDFIMLDNRAGKYDFLTAEHIQKLCDRRFGIGADGLICINQHATYAFEVDYSNSDGSKSFCGNGARCSVAFAQELGIDCKEVEFLAIDGSHLAKMESDWVSVQMQPVQTITQADADYILNTGSPHYVRFCSLDALNSVVSVGKSIRYNDTFRTDGINVNLVTESGNTLHVATYERGVEDETLSCGTGVTAAALAMAYKNKKIGNQHVEIESKGGKLSVSFQVESSNSFSNIWLSGPAVFVFRGTIDV